MPSPRGSCVRVDRFCGGAESIGHTAASSDHLCAARGVRTLPATDAATTTVGFNTIRCPRACGGHGSCDLQGFCLCERGFWGIDCGETLGADGRPTTAAAPASTAAAQRGRGQSALPPPVPPGLQSGVQRAGLLPSLLASFLPAALSPTSPPASASASSASASASSSSASASAAFSFASGAAQPRPRPRVYVYPLGVAWRTGAQLLLELDPNPNPNPDPNPNPNPNPDPNPSPNPDPNPSPNPNPRRAAAARARSRDHRAPPRLPPPGGRPGARGLFLATGA